MGGKADQIFDAFFTTKPQGSGTDLAIRESIVKIARRQDLGQRQRRSRRDIPLQIAGDFAETHLPVDAA
jgi:signal transduction histidine kinase